MTETPNNLPQIGETEALKTGSRSLWWYSWRRLRKNKLAMVGLVIISLLILMALCAPLIAPMDPNRQVLEYVRKPSGFVGNLLLKRASGGAYKEEYIAVKSYSVNGDSVQYVDELGRTHTIAKAALAGAGESEWHQQPHYLLGSDDLGRDVLSRLIYGAQVSLSVGLIAEMISLFIGLVLGALAGYFRGWVDSVVMYMANVIWSFPFILLVIALSIAWQSVWGQYVIPLVSPIWPGIKESNAGFWQAFIAIGIANWVDTARIVRGQFFSLRETEYVEATRALGFGSMRTIFRHMIPNVLGPITVITTAGFANAIMAEASLAYVGMGVQVPMASWGQMIKDGYGNIMANTNWGLAIYPSIAIALAVFAFNMLGDGLRDALDPKLKR
ncbi:MAG: ABC transporter permease [Bacteroidetes bacterium]|nr:ABC transporter permease [Bacteroidota bacterium]